MCVPVHVGKQDSILFSNRGRKQVDIGYACYMQIKTERQQPKRGDRAWKDSSEMMKGVGDIPQQMDNNNVVKM